MMKSGQEVNSQDTGDPELRHVYPPGWFSIKNIGAFRTAEPLQAQARPSHTKCGNEAKVARIKFQLEGDSSSVGV